MSRLNAQHDDADALMTPDDRTEMKTNPGGVINPSKDGATGGWGTAARWFLLALLVILLVWGLLYIGG